MSFWVDPINKYSTPSIKKLGTRITLRPTLSDNIPMIGWDIAPMANSNARYTPIFNDEKPKVSKRYIGRNVSTATLAPDIRALDIVTDKACGFFINVFRSVQ